MVGIIVASVACCVRTACPLHRSHQQGVVVVTSTLQPYQNWQSTPAPILTFQQVTPNVAPPAYQSYPPAGQQPYPAATASRTAATPTPSSGNHIPGSSPTNPMLRLGKSLMKEGSKEGEIDEYDDVVYI